MVVGYYRAREQTRKINVYLLQTVALSHFLIISSSRLKISEYYIPMHSPHVLCGFFFWTLKICPQRTTKALLCASLTCVTSLQFPPSFHLGTCHFRFKYKIPSGFFAKMWKNIYMYMCWYIESLFANYYLNL